MVKKKRRSVSALQQPINPKKQMRRPDSNWRSPLSMRGASTIRLLRSNATELPSNAICFCSNATELPSNAIGFCSNATELPSNAMGFCSNATELSSNATGFCSNATKLSSNAMVFCSNATELPSNAIGFCSNATELVSRTPSILPIIPSHSTSASRRHCCAWNVAYSWRWNN